MFGNAFELIESLVRDRTPIRKGMAVLLDLCNRVIPSTVWEPLLHLDYENDARQWTKWLTDLLESEPPPAEINGFYFGLFNPIRRDGTATSCLYLGGSTRFDNTDWSSGLEYCPESRHMFSSILSAIYRAVNAAEEGISAQGEFTLCLGYASLLVASWCHGTTRTALLGESTLRGVAVGFDAGDLMQIDVLTKENTPTCPTQVMDEAGWLVSNNPERMLQFIKGSVSDRKLRLFAVACCRRIWHMLTDERSRQAVEVAERFADGQCAEGDLEAAQRAAQAAQTYQGADIMTAEDYATLASDVAFWIADRAAGSVSHSTLAAAACNPNLGWFDDGRESESIAQASLLRDICGNPFRPQTNLRDWSTPTVLALAESIYTESAFDRLPILGDALEDAGCTDQSILVHCREPGLHIRGCWLIDSLLGKQ